MAKERPRKKKAGALRMVISFCPKRMKSKKWGRGRERERERERDRERGRERERQQEERTTVKLMILGVVLVVSCTCMLQYACFSLFFPARPALKARISHVIVSTSKRPEFVHCVLLLWYIISGDATSMKPTT